MDNNSNILKKYVFVLVISRTGSSSIEIALQKLGYKEIECVIVDLNIEDEKELNIRLNANTGSFDFDVLANSWDENLLLEWGLYIQNFDSEVESEEKEGNETDKCIVCGK